MPPARLAARARRRRARLVTFGAVAILIGSLFGVVAFHVVLAQGQLQLQQLQDRQNAEHVRHQRLELEVAELESPARIVAAAQQQLGMIAPASVTYLSPVSP
ncbi:MAG: cell division protein FtsL, partial [Acidimicrobiales bacterium]